MTEKWAQIAIFIVALVCLGVVIYEIAEIVRTS